MPELFFPHVGYDFWDEFDHWLWVSYLQNVVQVQLGLVFSQPFFPPIFLSIKNFFELLLIKVGLHQVQCWLLWFWLCWQWNWLTIIRLLHHTMQLLIVMYSIKSVRLHFGSHIVSMRIVDIETNHHLHWLLGMVGSQVAHVVVHDAILELVLDTWLTWVDWLIDHHWLWHWLRFLQFVALKLLHGVVTLRRLVSFAASVCLSNFWMLRILGDFVVLRGAILVVALPSLRFAAIASSGLTASGSIVLRWALSLAHCGFLLFRMFRYVMVWTHLICDLVHWFLGVSLDVICVLMHGALPGEAAFGGPVLLQAGNGFVFALRDGIGLVGGLLSIFFILHFIVMSFD